MGEVSPYIPDPKGKPIIITTFFDVDHSHGIETGWSVIVVLMFLKKSI